MILIKGRNSGGEVDPESHFVIGTGCKVFTNGQQYIRVIDGWYVNVNRYVNWNGPDIISYKGGEINIQ